LKPRALVGLLAGFGVVALAGCELTEVTLVDFADVVVAEVYVTVEEAPADNQLRAFLHGTAPGSAPSSATFDDAQVTVTDGDGAAAALGLTAIDACATVMPEGATGSCFAADAVLAASYEPGEPLQLDVVLSDGRSLSGSTRIPGAFAVDGVSDVCLVAPDTRLPLAWTPSDSAWAYINEAYMLGLPAALASEGIEAPDTLYLLGLSISESDTTVSFPDEFGVFDRFDLDQDLAVRLQEGLPEGASSEVTISAVDRNYTNWVRGGNFNPSGAVRISSLVGDGAGVFGSAVTRRFTVVSSTDPMVGPPCSGP
jgi:hypothetical protein